MNKVVKFAVLPLVGMVAVVAAIATYLVATFDPNQYKAQIVQAVKDQTGRTIRLEGDIKLSLFPGIGVTLGKVWVSEHASEQEFAGVEDVRIAMKLRPLLSKRIVIDTVEISNLRANVVRARDGKINIDDLAGGEIAPASSKRAPVSIDVAHFVLRNATITYIDQLLNSQYVLSKLDLETGRLANSVPSAIDLSFVLQSDQPKLDLNTTLKTTVTFDLGKRIYALQDLDLKTKGRAAAVSDLAATAKGNVEASLASQEFLISKLSLVASGKHEGGDLIVKLEMPAFSVTQERSSGEGIQFDATSSTRTTKMTIRLAVPAVSGTGHAFQANELAASVDLQQVGASIGAKATGPLTGNLDTRKFELSKLALTVRITNPKLLKNPLAATLNATAQADFTRQTAALVFATRIDASSVNGKVELTKFAPLFYTFDVNIDQLDADRYLPTPNPKEPDEPFDLSMLKDLNANGSLKIGVLTIAGVKASNVRLDIKPDGGPPAVATPTAKPTVTSDRGGVASRKSARARPTPGP